MMLKALYDYAEKEGLGDVDFEESLKVDYRLVLGADGTFLGLMALATGKEPVLLKGVPIRPADNNPGSQRFLVANATYVLGTSKGGSAGSKGAARSSAAYRELIDAAQESNDEGLHALKLFLSKKDQVHLAEVELAQKEERDPEKRADRVLAPFLEDDGTYLHEREKVRRWWMRRREAERAEAAEGPRACCLVTGRLEPVVLTHSKLKGPPFPGIGAPLVAFEKSARAYSSQHLEKGANAPVSELAARRYVAALNHLLQEEGGHRRGAMLLDRETTVVFWTRDESEVRKPLLSLFDAPSRLRDAVESVEDVWLGVRATTFKSTPFYAVTLSSNSGRVVVRDWFETTAARVKENLQDWFKDLHLGGGDPMPLPVLPMLRAIEATPGAQRDKRGLPSSLGTCLFRAAVNGGPLPRSLLAAALERVRLPPREKQKREDALFDQRARFGIIKAVLRRLGKKEITVALDESNVSTPYLLGRLFAVLERLQALAQGNVNATIRDRYFGTASRTPGVVFPRLIDLSQHHLKKLAAGKKGLAVNLDKLLGAIFVKILSPFPATLRLEEQGEFAIGYYHQREFREPVQSTTSAAGDVSTKESAS